MWVPSKFIVYRYTKRWCFDAWSIIAPFRTRLSGKGDNWCFCLVAIVIDLVLIGLMTIWLLWHQLETWSKLSCILLLICRISFPDVCSVVSSASTGFECLAPSWVLVFCTIMGFECLAPSRVLSVLHHHGFWVSCTITGFECLAPSRVWVSCTITGLGVLHQLRCNWIPWRALTISLSAPVFFILWSCLVPAPVRHHYRGDNAD